jgi:hypothetical protein
MAKRLLMAVTTGTTGLYILNRNTPAVEAFTPALPTLSYSLGPRTVWAAPTGEIITDGKFVSLGPGIGFAHFKNGVWALKATPTPAARAYSIHGSSYNNVWSVHGDTYDVNHFDGNTWVKDATLVSPSRCQDVFALDDENVFVASDYGLWFRRSGAIGSGVWTNERSQMNADTGIPIGDANRSNWVIAFAPNDVYFGMSDPGSDIYILHWNGTVWSGVWDGFKGPEAASASGFSGTQIWSLGTNGANYVRFYNGSSIVSQKALTDVDNFGDLVMFDEQLGYVVGTDTPDRWSIWETVDGSSWSRIILAATGGSIAGSVGAAVWDSLPTIQNQNPASDQTAISIETDILIEVVDGDPGLDASTVILTIDGRVAWQNEAAQTGFSVNVSPITDGYRYVIDPDINFESYSYIQIDIDAYDTAGNYLDAYYTFRTVDADPPEIANKFPLPDSGDISQNTLLSVDIFNRKSGVDFSSIEVLINGVTAYNGNFISPYDGYNSAITATTVDGYDGYNIILDKISPFVSAEQITIEVFSLNMDGY